MAAAVDEFFYACQNMPVFWLGDNGRDSRSRRRLAEPVTWRAGRARLDAATRGGQERRGYIHAACLRASGADRSFPWRRRAQSWPFTDPTRGASVSRDRDRSSLPTGTRTVPARSRFPRLARICRRLCTHLHDWRRDARWSPSWIVPIYRVDREMLSCEGVTPIAKSSIVEIFFKQPAFISTNVDWTLIST